ncbi:hypothetical protein [Brevibacillus sp. 179-C9.3 HS]
MERVEENDRKSNGNRHTEERKLPEAWQRFLEAVQQQFSENQRDNDETK